MNEPFTFGAQSGLVEEEIPTAESSSEAAPKSSIVIPTPYIQTTATLVILYSLIVLLVDVIFAVITRRWVLIGAGFFQLWLYLMLWLGMLQVRRWAWWVCVIGGVLFIFRYLFGIL